MSGAALHPVAVRAVYDVREALEHRLHERFAAQRVNLVNMRREFFYLAPSEVRAALSEEGLAGTMTEFVEDAEAEEWRASEATRSRGRR